MYVYYIKQTMPLMDTLKANKGKLLIAAGVGVVVIVVIVVIVLMNRPTKFKPGLDELCTAPEWNKSECNMKTYYDIAGMRAFNDDPTENEKIKDLDTTQCMNTCAEKDKCIMSLIDPATDKCWHYGDRGGAAASFKCDNKNPHIQWYGCSKLPPVLH